MTKEKQDRFALRMPPAITAEVTAYAERKQCNFNEAVRQLILAGLEADKAGQPGKAKRFAMDLAARLEQLKDHHEARDILEGVDRAIRLAKHVNKGD